MKNESPLAVVQTVALCLIAVLLLVQTFSRGSAPAANSLQELAAAYDLKMQMASEKNALEDHAKGMESAWLGDGQNPQSKEINEAKDKVAVLAKKITRIDAFVMDIESSTLSK